jgi:dienelactone hydrolase
VSFRAKRAASARSEDHGETSHQAQAISRLPVRLEIADVVLNADLSLPSRARGLVIFAHGSGSSRHSSRNCAVADVLTGAGFGTLLLDLLTEQEEAVDERTGEHRFNILLLAGRVAGAIDWAQESPQTASLSIGLFGASTGAAAALSAAARRAEAVHAVVSRGGRPDLAEESLESVTAPTLLIIGGRDDVVIELNRLAFARMKGPKALEIVAGATHLFEERGALEQVAALATDWFMCYLPRATSSGQRRP